MFRRTSRFPIATNILLRQIHDNATLLEGVTEIVNRNPRNLERLRIARKPKGYHLDVQDSEYWHKLVIVKHTRYVSAEIHHFENGPVITASTNEVPIRQHLYRPMDTSAYFNLGRILADRCLKCGICMVYCPADQKSSRKQKILCDAFVQSGVILEEYERYIDPAQIPNRSKWPEKTWETFE